MVRVKSIGRFDVNATFGEDGAAGGSFVPKLSHLGRVGAAEFYPKDFVSLPKDEPFYQPEAPTDYVSITPKEQAAVDAQIAARSSKMPTTYLLIAGGSLLAVGLGIYLFTRPSAERSYA